MRKLSAGNKTRFTIFALLIICTILVLIIILNKVLSFEKEEYAVEKEVVTYDSDYEYVSLTTDAVIAKKWTGKYYLNETETGLSYELGTTAVTYNSIKNKLNLYGTFYKVALDGEITKTTKNTEITNMIEPQLYKIDDRKYLVVSEEISNENGSLTADNYLMVVIDKSGNTLLLNNNIDIKTINAIILKTDTFKFDVANEKLIYEDTTIDLKKIIGSSNEYVEPEKKKEKDENSNGSVGGSQSSTNATVNVGGSTTVIQNPNTNTSNSTSGGNESNTNNNDNKTEVIKSVSLRSITPGETYLDVNYLITDPNNEYQVVYLNINGKGYTDTISLDKTMDYYRITGLSPNTDYSVSLGYKVIKSDATVDEVTEDVLNIKTLKLQCSLSITKVTEDKIYFNLKIDKNSNYENAKLYVYLNEVQETNYIHVDIDQAISAEGWTSSMARTDDMVGRIRLSLQGVDNVTLTASAQIY